MEIIRTRDGSYTFFSETFSETYKSKTGAIEESLKKFIGPLDMESLAQKRNVHVLDVCFGTGFNSLALLSSLFKRNPNLKLHITALENDRKILDAMKTLPIPIEYDVFYVYLKQKVGKVLRNEEREKISVKEVTIEKKLRKPFLIKKTVDEKAQKKILSKLKKNVTFELLLGDARRTIKKTKKMYDVVFLDPFSPKVSPHLWSYGFIKNIYDRCSPGCTLTTYSCARMVRDNMRKAGFQVTDGPCVGRRAPSTVAKK